MATSASRTVSGVTTLPFLIRRSNTAGSSQSASFARQSYYACRDGGKRVLGPFTWAPVRCLSGSRKGGRGMSDDIRSEAGFLILADISGFTAFVVGTELEHGAQVTGVLLEAVMRRLAPPLEIQELEGDAVFAIGADGSLPEGSVLPALLADAFGVFKEEQRRMAGDESW